MRGIVHGILRRCAKSGRLEGIYRRVVNPDGYEWAAHLKSVGAFKAMGRDCSIQSNVHLNRGRIRLGDNVRMTGCSLFCHDGSVNMINRAFGLKLDKVGDINIGSNVFIGHGAVIMPSVTIGDNVIVAAGAVVTKDVPTNSVVGGVPARRLCSLDEHVARRRQMSLSSSS
jgi:acetyltransferase-like isoleucine patch superfamily enzyme